jgi:hypothetical protein
VGCPARCPIRHDLATEAVKRGYAYVVMNERGHFFSEGTTISSVHQPQRVRRDPVDFHAVVGQRKGRTDRVLIHG